MAISLAFGWVAVLISIFFWGFFSVPMKFKRVLNADLNTFVFNFYLTIMVVTLPFLVLIFAPFHFSGFGMLAGIVWIPCSVSFPIAIQNIGISKGQSIWAILILLISFFWGIVFGHKVKSVGLTVLALIFLVVGVSSLGFLKQNTNNKDQEQENKKKNKNKNALDNQGSDSENIPLGNEVNDSEYDSNEDSEIGLGSSGDRDEQTNQKKKYEPKFTKSILTDGLDSDISNDLKEMEVGFNSSEEEDSKSEPNTKSTKDREHKPNLKMGILGIALIAIFGGSQMVPLEFASEEERGIAMPISFGFGAFLGASVIFAIVCTLHYRKHKTLRDLLQLNVIRYPLASGTLWTIGNIFAIIATMSPLGMSQGYSIAQLNVVVSSLVGIIFYKELAGKQIIYFCGSFTLATIGAVLLGIYG
ncbi:transmembrane protein [Anaeramoeba flamelloides]|uniref:Transmembrane protein n=1 Tax=Anaeramoeba flamelloides TaxID=1746091 RepID=A0AAV8A9C0_9EUKA|nr:transmembrane protein [Anaeramoeba flamelloides]